VVTVAIVGINVVVFLLELVIQVSGSLDVFFLNWGVIPYDITHGIGLHAILTLFTSMFLHGGFLHIAGNMLYLWIFGNNVEDAMGRPQYAIFYLLCGVLSGLTQVAAGPNVQIPSIGASGAIAGVLGAYIVLFPRARVATLIFLGIFVRTVNLPAILVLGFWFLLQLLNGVLSMSTFQSGGVAWFAHIGGFLAGLVLVWLFARRPRPPAGPTQWQ
jgi:membrane associated rhomboid family serine protease